jgi:hypothetical protein
MRARAEATAMELDGRRLPREADEARDVRTSRKRRLAVDRRGFRPAWPALGAVLMSLHGLVTAAQAAPLFHKTITINPGQVTGGPLTNFPFLFSSTDPALRTTANGGRVTNVSGWDIIFATSPTCADSTTCGGNKLDHEIESYNAATGQFIAWVRLPSIDNGTVFYLHYSDAAVGSSTENKPGVWDANYKGVWHLKETPAGVADEVKDSTSNGNDGTGEVGPASFPTQTAGQVDGSLAFDGTLERDVVVPHDASLQFATNMTVSAWAKTTSSDDQSRLIVAKWNTTGSAANYWLGKLNTGPGTNTFNFGVDGGPTAGVAIGLVNDGLWHYVVGVLDAGSGLLRLYVDGNQRSTFAHSGSQTGTSELRIGRSPDALAQDWDGGIDEVRVSSASRSAGWIQTEYRNQSSPSTFYTLGGMRVRSGSYVGDGVNGRAIKGLGFRPDVVLIASGEMGLVATERQAVIRTSTMVGNASRSIASNLTTPLADRIQSLDADGFTVGHPSPEDATARQTCANHAGVTYYWTAFQAAAGEMKVGTYLGNGSDNRDVTGIGFPPDYVLVMSDNTPAAVWQRSSAMAGDLSLAIEGLSGTNRIQALLADGFQVGTDVDVNQNGTTFHYVAWKAVAGKMNVGTYTGNNADPRSFTGVGFRPEYVVVRRSQTDDSVMKPAATGSGTDWSLLFRCYTNCGESNSIQALERDGFQVGNNSDVNLTGGTYYWAAFGPRTETYYRSIGTRANDSAGTVSVANGSTVVTGIGTTWKTWNRGRGDRIRIGTVDYLVAWVESETQLRLATPYAGATASGLAYTIARQFTTLQAWENCISGGACTYFPVSSASLVADGRREVGIAYNDSVFTLTSNFIFSGSTTDALHSITLTADPGNRHNGTPGAGVRIYENLAPREIEIHNDNVTLEWLELYGFRGGDYLAQVRVIGPTAQNILLQNLLMHDFYDPTANIRQDAIRLSDVAGKSVTVRNSMVWDGDDMGIVGDELSDTLTIENCSVDWMHDAGAYGISGQLSYVTVRNTISTNNTSAAFRSSGGTVTGSNNTSSDASAATYFSNAQTGVAGSSVFVSSGVAAANLHLKTGANVAVDSGLDLSSTFVLDVDGQLRTGVTWDRGADERDAATAVRLMSFDATAGDGSVTLEWRTGTELDNLGFHVYRGSSVEGPWTRLTTSLIPGLGSSPVGQAYSWLDTGLMNGTRYYYRLEDVDASSKSTFHGPVSAVPVPEPSPPGEDGGDGGGGDGSERGEPGIPSCPSWVLSAAPDAVSPTCTRHGDPESVSLSVLSRSASSATLELRTGGFWALHDAGRTVRVFVPGFEYASDPRAPALPIRRTLVEAVVGKQVHLVSAEALDQQAIPDLRPAAVGTAEVAVGGDGTVRPARRALAAPVLPARGLVPAEVARLAGTVFQGERKSAVVEMTPVRFDGRQLVLAGRVRVRLAFTGVAEGEVGTGSRGRASPRREAPFPEVLAQLYTTSRGLYAVRYEQLFPDRTRGFSTLFLRLQRQGEAVAFHVEPPRSVFGPGSVLYFYADRTASSTDYSSEVAYELVRKPGLPMGSSTGAPLGGPVASPSTGFASFETNRIYMPDLLEAQDVWLWQAAISTAAAPPPVAFSLSGLATGSAEPARLVVDLQGGSESGLAVDHHVRVLVNGGLVGEATFAGKRPYRLEVALPVWQLREGSNELQLENVADTGVVSRVFLDRFEVSYPQVSMVRGGVFEGVWAESGAVEVSSLSGPAVILRDSGQPGPEGSAVRWLTGFEVAPGSVRFQAEAGQRYLVVCPEGILAPRVGRVALSTVRETTNQADYLVIAPRALLQAAGPLVERRRGQGLSSRAVAIEEIASEFGHAQASAEAIKEFLSYAYHSWRAPSPRYVLLLGDATYDPRHFQATSWASPLPALWVKTSYLWTVSDQALAAVNGEDLLPDLAIGRLPATTVEEAERLVGKLLAWEESGEGLSGKAVFVADDPDAGGDFEADVEDVRVSFLGDRETTTLKVRELGSDARAAIVDSFDEGASLMSYVGHGGPAVWASENVLSSWDALSLRAQSRQPFLLTMNCLNGYFVAPNVDALPEAFLKAEGRGVVGAFSPSGLSLDGPAHEYHRALMGELVSGAHARLGDAILAAQRDYGETGLMPELLAIYHLLGDPAMRIQ